jgi:ribonuclease-3
MLKLDYVFKNKDLLEQALTQSGASAQHNNERLEFLGDRVLGLSAAELLYNLFPSESEGALAQRHAALVSTVSLEKVANELGLFSEIKHTHLTANNRQNITADAMEAVFGAIYLDGGFDAARKVVQTLIEPLAKDYTTPPKDAKTSLQEYTQKEFGELPVYEFLEETGPSHNPNFRVRVSAGGKLAEGVGNSKKSATLNAAEKLLGQMG